ncbi:hypothetical protein AYK24_08405 [Thermoplasmatales archaeon SG8-52-4]|nr:MAG: hypothetical protein AYK24_08405 [Thermoplasmatales archaeon SG8-52-4]
MTKKLTQAEQIEVNAVRLSLMESRIDYLEKRHQSFKKHIFLNFTIIFIFIIVIFVLMMHQSIFIIDPIIQILNNHEQNFYNIVQLFEILGCG